MNARRLYDVIGGLLLCMQKVLLLSTCAAAAAQMCAKVEAADDAYAVA